MPTYLEELQAAVKAAREAYDNARSWAEQGATIDHGRRELERAERETADRLAAAMVELNAHLQCPEYQEAHQPVEFTWCGYSQQYICECPDCCDGEYTENGLRRTNPVGYGKTESEALADLLEKYEE